jgi:hypothetical protein
VRAACLQQNSTAMAACDDCLHLSNTPVDPLARSKSIIG